MTEPTAEPAADDEFVGNALCLDFANTVNARPRATRDHLDTAAGLAAWARAAGIGSPPAVPADLPAGPVDPPAVAADLPVDPADVPADPAHLAAARELREAIYRTFSAVAAAAPPAATDLATIASAHAEAVAAARLESAGDRFALTWPTADPRWPVAASATRLLLDGPLDRVGECPSCHWLFLDTSRNGRRRWCSMATCGSRVKAQRHYAHKTGAADQP